MQRIATDEEIAEDFPELEDDGDDEDFDDDLDGYDDEDEEPQDRVPVGVSPDDPAYSQENAPVITLEELESIDDTSDEKFFVKEWKYNVVVKGISMEELRHIRRKANTKQAKISGTRREIMERELIISGLVQPPGNLQTYNVLVQKSAGAVAAIANKILEKSGMADEAEEKREQRFPRKR